MIQQRWFESGWLSLRYCLLWSKMLSLSVSVAATSHNSIEIEYLVAYWSSLAVFSLRVCINNWLLASSKMLTFTFDFLTPVSLEWAISQRWCLSINKPEVRNISLPIYLAYCRKFLISFFRPGTIISPSRSKSITVVAFLACQMLKCVPLGPPTKTIKAIHIFAYQISRRLYVSLRNYRDLSFDANCC